MNVLHYASFFDCPSLVEALVEADKGLFITHIDTRAHMHTDTHTYTHEHTHTHTYI